MNSTTQTSQPAFAPASEPLPGVQYGFLETSDQVLALRSAFFQMAQRQRLRPQVAKSWQAAAQDIALSEFLQRHFDHRIEARIAEFGDGRLIDQFLAVLEWVVEHREEILQIIESILKIVALV